MEETLHYSIDKELYNFYSKNSGEPSGILLNDNNFNKLTDLYSEIMEDYPINKIPKTLSKNAKYRGIRILICNDLKDDEIKIVL